MGLNDAESIGTRQEIHELQRRLDAQAQQFERQMETVRADLDKNSRLLVAEEVRTRLHNLLKASALVVGLLGGLGILGLLTKTIPDTVEARIKSTVDGLSASLTTSLKERTDALIDDARAETAKLGDEVKKSSESLLKEAQTTVASVVENVKTNAAEIKALRDQVHRGAWIVLQTDYGDQDHYMGALKGAILCEDPGLRLDTITAENPDYDLGTAAHVLHEASQHYPPGTVFLILVNPGATQTDPIVLHTKNDLYFVAYDNGGLDIVARQFEVESVRTVTNAHKTCERAEAVGFALTWLAPTAAWLARAADQAQAFAEVGAARSKYEFKLPEPRKPEWVDSALKGEITSFDRFGNAWTNIPGELVRQSGFKFKENLKLKVGEIEVQLRYGERYSDVDTGAPVAIVYNGFLQFAINRDSFRNTHKVKRGALVEVSRAGE